MGTKKTEKQQQRKQPVSCFVRRKEKKKNFAGQWFPSANRARFNFLFSHSTTQMVMGFFFSYNLNKYHRPPVTRSTSSSPLLNNKNNKATRKMWKWLKKKKKPDPGVSGMTEKIRDPLANRAAAAAARALHSNDHERKRKNEKPM